MSGNPEESHQTQTGEGRIDGCRILIADDNIDAADSLAMLLGMEGHKVVVARNGEDAWRAFEQHRPEVALLDIGMPKVTGHELARRIRTCAGGDRVLLIAITGWGQEKDRRLSVGSGFDHHLTKPVEPEELARLIRKRLKPD